MSDLRRRVPQRDPDTRFTQVRGQSVLIRGEYMYRLNAPGAEIWKRCDGGHSVDEILSALEAVFPGVERVTLERDCEEFLSDLHANGLLTWREE